MDSDEGPDTSRSHGESDTGVSNEAHMLLMWVPSRNGGIENESFLFSIMGCTVTENW